MNSIKILKLENFQSHLNTVIAIAPNGNLSVITGSSDSGKTALLRALKWVLFNTPSGDDFVRAGATFARVTVEFASGDIVVRWRSTGSINRYIVNGETYEGFGSNVPLEVSQVSGIMPVKIGDLELNLNLAEQLQGPFLGSAISGGARAKVLGKLAGTEEIDYAAKQLGTDLYRRNQDEKRLSVEVAGLEEDIKTFDYLPAMARKIEQLEVLTERVKAGQALRGKLVGLKASLENIDEKIAAAQVALFRWRNLDAAESYLLVAQEKIRLSVTLGLLNSQMQGLAGNIYYARLIIAKWSGLSEAERLLPIITSSQTRKERLATLAKRYQMDDSNVEACQEIIERHAGLADAEGLLRNTQAAAEKATRLRHMRTSYNAGQEMIKRSQDVLDRLETLDAAEELLRSLDVKKQLREKLKGLEAIYFVENRAAINLEERLAKLAGVDEAGEKLAKAAEKQSRLKQLKTLKGKYTLYLDAIEAARLIAIERENRVAELEGAYHDELDFLGVCPMCGALKNEMRIREAV